jgi:hypothetical protein
MSPAMVRAAVPSDEDFTMKPTRHSIARDELEHSIIEVACKCPVCGGSRSLKVARAGYLAWIHGVPIQRALPELNGTEREMLLTGIDDRCWDRLFDSGEEGAEQLARILSDAKGRV